MFKRIVMLVVIVAFSTTALAAAKQTKQITGQVNINTATVSELTMLPGIGKSKAEAIVQYRKTTPFKSAQELTKIKGIGQKMIAKLSPFVVTEGATTAKVVKSGS